MSLGESQANIILYAILTPGVGVDRRQPEREFRVRARSLRLPRRHEERRLAAVLGARRGGVHEVDHRENPGGSGRLRTDPHDLTKLCEEVAIVFYVV